MARPRAGSPARETRPIAPDRITRADVREGVRDRDSQRGTGVRAPARTPGLRLRAIRQEAGESRPPRTNSLTAGVEARVLPQAAIRSDRQPAGVGIGSPHEPGRGRALAR